MSDEDKKRLIKRLENDIGFEDETLDQNETYNNNEESQDESDLF